MTHDLPTSATAKSRAKALRAELAKQGTDIGHAQALELIAREHGFRDWNSLKAAIGDRPPEEFVPGGKIEGSYLSQPFKATVVAVEMLRPGWFRLTLELDTPVDVVTFDSFSNYRSRLQTVVGPEGTSREKTSDGEPHVRLDI